MAFFPQRSAAVKILTKSKGHPNVETTHTLLRKDFPTISLATVYRDAIFCFSTVRYLG
jgi:Fur family peroxide stress response transcriptional regulator